jgi:hypothetical protein
MKEEERNEMLITFVLEYSYSIWPTCECELWRLERNERKLNLT